MPTTTAATPISTNVSPYTSTASVSPYASGYVTDMLNTASTLADKPYEAYGGNLVAGFGADTQVGKALGGIGSLTMPSDISQAATNTGNLANSSFSSSGVAQQYMNPYLQASLNPQIAEAQRQSQISQLGTNAQLAKAGAYGGSRQAIMNAENQRNLNTNLANIEAQGYNTAYDKAMAQYNQEQQQKLNAYNQQANLANMGLNANEALLKQQLEAGQTQRSMEQEGITSAYNQWKEAQQYPYQQLKFQSEMLSGLPITQQNVTTPSNWLSKLTGGITGLNSLASALGAAGFLKDATGKPVTNLGGALQSLIGSGNTGWQQVANNATQGQPGYGWSYYTDQNTGASIAIDPNGTYYDAATNTVIWDPTTSPDWGGSTDYSGYAGDTASSPVLDPNNDLPIPTIYPAI